MHWFWRAAIGVGVTVGFDLLYRGLVVVPIHRDTVHVGSEVPSWFWAWLHFNSLLKWSVLFASFWIVTKYLGPKAIDPETRCRKCGHILRNLIEPRCPECGETI